MTGLLYLIFFLSGVSGLIYQVVWVRVFGNVFGNTVHSAALVVAIFMLGLGAGSYIVGTWADRRYAARPDSLLRAYGVVELLIAVMGLAIAAVLPHLGEISAWISSYTREPSGWYTLSTSSYVARAAVAVILLTPITLLMGGTLTLLIRHLVRRDLANSGWQIAVLYGVNTAGAAVGALLTDFALVPASGLWGTQVVAVVLNAVAGVGALFLSARPGTVRVKPDTATRKKKARAEERLVATAVLPQTTPAIVLTGVALALAGVAAMGMEILWFRHFTMLLGGFRAVFSLLLTVILIGIGVGSLAGGFLQRRTGRPGEVFMLVQGLFVAVTLVCLVLVDVRAVDAAVAPAERTADPTLAELWFNARPMLLEVALPALLMGFTFPLANALIQRAEQSVGRRAGMLYLANTAGAVGGSLAAGFVLLPSAGLQVSATILMGVAAIAIVPLYLATRSLSPQRASAPAGVEAGGAGMVPAVARRAAAVSVALGGGALALWLLLPSDYVITRAMGVPQGSRLLTISDGLTEVIAVTERDGRDRTLMTNGHPMSSTQPLSQRYMRALAHIPLLSMNEPESVLVIGFGVGNTTHAATLHPSVARVELADLSRAILVHASYFRDGNKDVLDHPRLAVYINDGRQHLQMQPPASYDLITLEPPPIAYAGVGALYSKEFYALARTRLRPGGYISQWLPAYQVPAETTLAMVRAFVDVFPEAVLLSGAESDLLLLGTTAARIEIDPEQVAARLAGAPGVRADLERIDLDDVHEIVGTFVGAPSTLAAGTREAAPVTDDRPLQEYGVRSMLNFGRGVPSEIVDLGEVAAWCPRCFVNGAPVPAVAALDTYLALLDVAYGAARADVARVREVAERQGRVLAGSRYLGMIVPESAAVHNLLGIAHASAGRLDTAVEEFREALRLAPADAAAHWHLGAALASQGAEEQAAVHLRRSVELDPGNGRAQNDLGVLLAGQGRLEEAIGHFRRALALDPGSADARRNLERALALRP
ncbi:MAG TPA: tetratricopeptide repeat protein [Vicinamibacterales bacterium]